MQDRELMNNFINYIARIKYDNPNLDITHNLVYGEFTRIGVSPESRKIDLSQLFPHWIERFKNVPNIEVKNTETWKYFCQFNNCKDFSNNRTFIKLYIPMDETNIYEGANTLFDFLAKEDIEHTSKIGSAVRNDDVVVRVTSVEDAEKIENFIKSQPIFQKSKLKPSPFAVNNGQIAYATDANISYNSEIATLISEYINDLNHEQLVSANINDFSRFVTMTYNKVFDLSNNKPEKERLIQKFEMNRKLDRRNYSDRINTKANMKEISQNIIDQLYGTLSKERIYDTFKAINDPMHMREIEDEIIKSEVKNNTLDDTLDLIDIPGLIEDIIITNYSKYGYDHIIMALKTFIATGDIKQFTRNNDSRSKLSNNFSPSDISKYITDKYGSISVESLVSDVITKNNSIVTLENASIETLKKYGINQLTGAINSLRTGDFRKFTNTNNARQNLITYFNYNKTDEIMGESLKRAGIEVSENTNIQFEYLCLMNKKLEDYLKYQDQGAAVY